MKDIKTDLFKILFLIAVIYFVYSYKENSKIGRFMPIGATNSSVLDTKNGSVYVKEENRDSFKLIVKPILK